MYILYLEYKIHKVILCQFKVFLFCIFLLGFMNILYSAQGWIVQVYIMYDMYTWTCYFFIPIYIEYKKSRTF